MYLPVKCLKQHRLKLVHKSAGFIAFVWKRRTFTDAVEKGFRLVMNDFRNSVRILKATKALSEQGVRFQMGKKWKSINVAFLWAVVMSYQTLLAEPSIGESVGMIINRLDTCQIKSEGLNSGSLPGDAGFTDSITGNMVSFYEQACEDNSRCSAELGEDNILPVAKDRSLGDKTFALAHLNASVVLPGGLGRSGKIPQRLWQGICFEDSRIINIWDVCSSG